MKVSLSAHWTHLLVPVLTLLAAGCSTTRTDVTNNNETATVYGGESVVIMSRSYHTGNQTEKDFTDCISKSLDRRGSALNIMPANQFVDTMYPWFEPRTAPHNISILPRMMSNPLIAERMRETGVRYVVWLEGNTEQPNGGGSVSCAAGPAGAGCFGFAWWESISDYDAVVWDLEDGKEAGNIATEVSGTSYMPAIVIPIPMIARTQATACKDLSLQIGNFIGGRTDAG
ncbi:MAG: hypothetical protein AAAFM81_06280 [Pseudomonadota bacterium]